MSDLGQKRELKSRMLNVRYCLQRADIGWARSQLAGAKEPQLGDWRLGTGSLSVDLLFQDRRRFEDQDRRGEIVASVPVFGLRPMRCFFLRTMNDPNDRELEGLALHQAGGDLVQDEVDHGQKTRIVTMPPFGRWLRRDRRA